MEREVQGMKTGRYAAVLLVLLVGFLPVYAQDVKVTEVYGDGSNTIFLATGSPGELGLVKALAEAFNEENDTNIHWVMAGTGASLKMLKEDKVDLIMVHAPADEEKAVSEGWAAKRSLIGSNEFYIVGPSNDPAGIAKATSAADAYRRIASAQAKFFSRGDKSGTHIKEMAVWEKAGITPSGDWYIVTNDFMMATLKRANDEQGYFMTDSSTWVQSKSDLDKLTVLYRGDPMLVNTYHALCRPEGDGASQPYAAKFIDFIVSEKGQSIIRNYGKDLYGEPLYNDAEYARQYPSLTVVEVIASGNPHKSRKRISRPV
jgi:tungstate transport system substrate-binding protein